ncbi:MAG: serine/threonine-protein kinase [Myxococcota bacterium]|nr:serine/threonine-protein kinase [Myxococcota bacterium]
MEVPVKLGDYYLFERIAVGGMAEVFKAASYGVEAFERVVAVKRVLPSIAEDHEFIDMFIDEAKIAVQLSHANIGQVFELGNADNSYFIAMEYVSGRDARAVFDRGRAIGTKLDVAMCCHIVKEVCEALDYAHNKHNDRGEPLNLIHRDVSPQNILISYDGEVKLIDFGIAKAAGKASKTQSGILKGKFGYMSPEQLRGKPIDRRSDIFSLGTVLYELLTGERCFQGPDDFSVLEKVRKVDFRRPTLLNRMIPPELERIIYRSLTRNPDDRFQTSSAFKDELQKFLYQSGSFYSRRELADFMRETFARDLQDSKARLAEFRTFARANIDEARRPGSMDGAEQRDGPAVGQSQGLDKDALVPGVTDRSTAEDPSDALPTATAPAAPKNASSRARTIPYAAAAPVHQTKDPTRRLVWLGIITVLAVVAGLVTVFYALEFFGPSRIFLRTEPTQVAIYLDEKFKYEGQTPVELSGIAPGEHFLVIKANGYKTRREKLNLDRGRELSLKYRLERIANGAELVIETEPGGATVYVNDKRLDESPVRTNTVRPGQHAIRVEKEGYLPWQGRIDVGDNGTTRPPKIRLYPQEVMVTFVTEPRNAKVVIEDGAKRQNVPGQIGKRRVALRNTGTLRLTVSAAGYASVTKVMPKLLEEAHTEFIGLERVVNRTSKPAMKSPTATTSRQVAAKNRRPAQVNRSSGAVRRQTQLGSNRSTVEPRENNARVTVTQGKLDKPGFLKILSQPPAIAYVNGKNLGWTPIIRHALGAGRHAIMLVRETAPKFRKSMLVNIEPGKENFQRYVHPRSR